MAHICIAYTGVSSANQLLRKAMGEIVHMENTYAALKGRISPEIQSRYQIADRLRSCHQSIQVTYQATSGVLDVAESGLLEYRITETMLKRAIPTDEGMLEMR